MLLALRRGEEAKKRYIPAKKKRRKKVTFANFGNLWTFISAFDLTMIVYFSSATSIAFPFKRGGVNTTRT